MKICDTSQRLKQIIAERNIKQVDILRLSEPFCKKYNIKLSKTDLSQYVSGKVVPGQNKLAILGLALNVSEAWLMGFNVPMERDIAKIDVGTKDLTLSQHEEMVILSYRQHPEHQFTIDTILGIDSESVTKEEKLA